MEGGYSLAYHHPMPSRPERAQLSRTNVNHKDKGKALFVQGEEEQARQSSASSAKIFDNSQGQSSMRRKNYRLQDQEDILRQAERIDALGSTLARPIALDSQEKHRLHTTNKQMMPSFVDLLDITLPDGTPYTISYEDIGAAVGMTRQRYRESKKIACKGGGKIECRTGDLPYYIGSCGRLPTSVEFALMRSEKQKNFINAILLTHERLEEAARNEGVIEGTLWPPNALHKEVETLPNGMVVNDLPRELQIKLEQHRKLWKPDDELGPLKSDQRDRYMHAHLRLRKKGVPFPEPCSGIRPVTFQSVKEVMKRKKANRQARLELVRGKGDTSSSVE
ncbi:hypothetical protein CBS101457_003448 [Exobasidium rhododendri]|nr:hypothetical protein CBS101457_003448 [Exobasidium rhododendri]